MVTKHVRLFEAFGSSQEFMETEFSHRNRNRYNVDVENFPKVIKKADPNLSPEEQAELREMGFEDEVEIEDTSIDETIIKYEIKAYSDSSGISDIDFEMKAFRMNGTYTIWNEETDEGTDFDFEVEDSGPFDGRVEFKTNSLPFYPEGLTVMMNNSFDPSKFTYRVEIGQ